MKSTPENCPNGQKTPGLLWENAGSLGVFRERPILFSAPMVQAILAGRKIQTRRLVKQANDSEGAAGAVHRAKESGWIAWWPGKGITEEMTQSLYSEGFPCPYGKPGDRLWMRESWSTGKALDSFNATEIAKSHDDAGFGDRYPTGKTLYPKCPLWYNSDDTFCAWGDNDIEDFGEKGRRRHARFMPRWASRITLEITGVCVERLQEISEEDAEAEGADTPFAAAITGAAWSKRDAFAKLWEAINGKGSWALNPWLWVIEFRRIYN